MPAVVQSEAHLQSTWVSLLSFQNVSSVFWVLSSGISAGLFAVARIAGQLLTSCGIDGKRPTWMRTEDVLCLSCFPCE